METSETVEPELSGGLAYRFDYSCREAARIVGLSPARLRSWQRTGLLRDVGSADGFGFRDLVRIRALVSLLERGVPLRRIRRSVQRVRERIPELERPLDALRLGGEGGQRIVFRHRGQLVDPDGQLVLDLEGAVVAGSEPVSLASHVPESPAAELDALDWFERGCQLDGLPSAEPEAEDAYLRALECDPTFADAHCNLGAIRQQRGEREAARASYEAALEHEAAHVEARFNLAGLDEEEGDSESALRHYKRLLALDPAHAEAHLNAALLFDKLGLRRRARTHWRTYVGLRPRGNWADVARQRLRDIDGEGEPPAGP